MRVKIYFYAMGIFFFHSAGYAQVTDSIKFQGYADIFVEGGTFTMGCSDEQGSDCYRNENPAHQVTVPDFYIGKYEITQKQWIDIMWNNPSHYKWFGEDMPVEFVSWYEVQVFIEKLNAKTGENYRLPTEAEWEYAAKGGKESKGYKYSGSDTADKVAWYYANCRNRPHTIGTKQANELGIYDMSGNVWEWCSDWYSDYSREPQDAPTGAASGGKRIIRGGSWYGNARNIRVTFRNSYEPNIRGSNTGFRLARDAR